MWQNEPSIIAIQAYYCLITALKNPLTIDEG